MFHRDTFRLIKHTFNRFFSLLMIVLIGVAFMMGLLSTRPIMETSVDRYFDTNKLQDFQLYSSYGFDNNDVMALSKQEYVRECFPSRMVDVYSRNENGDIYVTSVEEITRNINHFELVEGRLPKNDHELVIINNSMGEISYMLNTTLELFLDDSDIHDYLENDTFTIVGIAKTPSYMAKMLGTSNLKNLELDMIVYVSNSNFKSDYYTTVYFTVNDASGMDTFSHEYSDYIGEVENEVRTFANKQQDNLKETLLEEYREEIGKGEKELEEKKAEGQQQLDDAKKQLDDAKIQIIASETQLETMKAALSTAETRVRALKKQYETESAALNEKKKSIEDKDASGRSFEQIFTEASTDYATYNALIRMKAAQSGSQYQENITRIENENAEYQKRLDNELYPRRDQLNNIISDSSISEAERNAAITELAEVTAEINTLESQIQVNELLIENLKDIESQGDANIDQMIADLDNKYGGSIESTYLSYATVAQDMIRLEATSEEIRIANEAIDRVNQEIRSAETEIAAGKREYESGEREYYDAVITFNDEIEKAESEIRKAYQELEELPDAQWIILNRESHYSSYMFQNNARQMGAIGISLPILFYLVAALVCMTTMTRLVDEQRGQIGIFRAMGFTKGEIISKYLIYAVSATLIGSFLGIIVGMMIFPTVIYTTWRLMYDLPDMLQLMLVGNIIICILAFTLLMMVVTYFVVRRCLNESASQLMRPKAPKNARKVFLENISFIWRKLSFTSKITARNLIRYKSRFFMTVIGVAGCTALLVVGWGIKDSISDVVAIQFGQIYNYNCSVNLVDDHNIDEMVIELENDLSNEYVTPIMTYSSKVYLDKEDKVLSVYVMDARKGNDVFNLRALDHKTPLKINNSGVLISQKFAQVNGIKAGDYITIESKNGIKAAVRVNDVCEMYFQHYIYMSQDYYDSVFAEPVHFNTIAVNSNDPDGLEERINDIEGFESLVDFTNVVDQFNTMIEALNFIILVIIITAGSLAFVVLVNLTQVNISERIREIATLKVLGFRDREINSYIFKEIMLLSIIGGLAGLPLGVLEHHFIMSVIDMEMIKFGNNIKLLSFAFAFVITIVFTVIVLFFTRKPLRKIEMIESLKSVE